MDQLKQYFSLQEQVNHKNAEIRIIPKYNPDETEKLEQELNLLLREREIILEELAQISEGSDEIQAKFIDLFSKYYEELKYFNDKPYYPDLNQRLIIEKFLLSDIVSNLRFILTVKGSSVHPKLLPSDRKWNTEPLVSFLLKNMEDLSFTRFINLRDALEWYIKIEGEIFKEVWPITNFIDNGDD